jgi:probable rRNA maturation factor
MPPAPLAVEITRSARVWAPPAAAMTRWAQAALGRRGANRALAVRIVAPRESRRLNAAYRGKDKPTNVLSFPAVALPGSARRAGADHPLGDLVICAAVVRDEAREQGKALASHWAHLVVHGALHLVGYDHVKNAEAARMERREIAVLRRFGIPNPYRARN